MHVKLSFYFLLVCVIRLAKYSAKVAVLCFSLYLRRDPIAPSLRIGRFFYTIREKWGSETSPFDR